MTGIMQVKVIQIQDELESGKRQKKSGMSLQQQVEHYRNQLLQKVGHRIVSRNHEVATEDDQTSAVSSRNCFSMREGRLIGKASQSNSLNCPFNSGTV